MPKSLAILGLAGTVCFATSAAAQLRTAPLSDIFESYNACFAATPVSGLEPKEIEALNWSRATVDDSGENPSSDLIIFGHLEHAPLILLSGESGKGVCIVSAKLDSSKDYSRFLEAFGDKLPVADDEGHITFMAQGRVVQLARTGSKKAPAMRAVVMTRENK